MSYGLTHPLGCSERIEELEREVARLRTVLLREGRLPGPDCFAHLNPEKYRECFGRTSCPRERACSE